MSDDGSSFDRILGTLRERFGIGGNDECCCVEIEEQPSTDATADSSEN